MNLAEKSVKVMNSFISTLGKNQDSMVDIMEAKIPDEEKLNLLTKCLKLHTDTSVNLLESVELWQKIREESKKLTGQ